MSSQAAGQEGARGFTEATLCASPGSPVVDSPLANGCRHAGVFVARSARQRPLHDGRTTFPSVRRIAAVGAAPVP